MATSKKFLDQIGVAYLWSKIKDELKLKASQSNLVSLENRVEELESTDVIEIYGGSATDVIEEVNG